MNLLFALLAISGVAGLVRFLVALRKEEKAKGPRSISIYIAQEHRPGLHKVSARCYGSFTVIEGGSAALPSKTKVVPAETISLTPRAHLQPDALRQESGYSQGA